MSTEKPHLSVSQLGLLGRCPKAWESRYVLGLKVPPGVAAVIGKGTHKAVELDLGAKMNWGELMTASEVKDAARDGLVRAWDLEPPVIRDGDPDRGEATDTAVSLAML